MHLLHSDCDITALVLAARAGCERAWRRLVTRFEPRLRAALRVYRLSRADTDDVLQATWLQFFRRLSTLREPAAAGAWLATTARREALNKLQSVTVEVLIDDPSHFDAPTRDEPLARALESDRRATVERSLAALPDRQRRLMLMLTDDAAPDYREISARLEMPVGSIGPTRARCLDRLSRDPELRALALAA